jgi:diguanylate cyclase (GGDEF)-like protein
MTRPTLLEENQRLREQVRLYQKSRDLLTLLDFEQLLPEVLRVLAGELPEGTRAFAFVATPSQVTGIFNGAGLNEEQVHALAQELHPRLQQLRKGERLDAVQLELPNVTIAGRQSLWVFPFQGNDRTWVLLGLLNPVGRAFPEPFPHDALQLLANQAALGVHNACQYQEARELIYSDDLTGLYNHRYLHIALEQEVRRSERYDLEFSVAFIDLDLLKQVNDRHGHLAGSSVLREVGTLLRQCVRDADLLFRYGGDEFTALLVETNVRGAQVVAERIRQAIAEHTFTLRDELTCQLTATIGYATYPIHAGSKQELIELADRAMYQAKLTRNATFSAADLLAP